MLGSSPVKRLFSNIVHWKDYDIEKYSMERCDQIVVLSKIRMKESSDLYNIPEDKFVVIPPGIDLEKLISAAKLLETTLGYTLPGQVMKSGPLYKPLAR